MRPKHTLLLAALVAAQPAMAGEADVLEATVERQHDGALYFEVTVRHADEGWEHYADAFEVLTPAGEIIATRVLYHPHVDEQPFTRELGGVRVPPGVNELVIRAHDKVHGYGGKTLRLLVPQ